MHLHVSICQDKIEESVHHRLTCIFGFNTCNGKQSFYFQDLSEFLKRHISFLKTKDNILCHQ